MIAGGQQVGGENVVKKGVVYVKETSLIKVKIIKEMNGEGSPLRTVIQYWTKDGRLVAEGYADQTDEPDRNDTAS